MVSVDKKPPASPHCADDPLARQALETIERYGMLRHGDQVLVGVSGGPDSIALLHLLYSLRMHYGLQLAVAHLDHGLRPREAEKELALVCALARQFRMPCHTGRLAALGTKGSVEEQLRDRRFAFFEKLAASHGYTKIALGHQAEDNAEAVLLFLLRGSGLRGLAGIPPVRGDRFIRPLIHTRREAIMAYVQRHGLNYAHDASNADPRYTRNKIRHQLLPLLRDHYNPKVVDTLNRLAWLCREEEQWLTSQLAPELERIVTDGRPQRLELAIDVLCALPRPAQRRLIRAALEQWQGHLRRMGADHIEAILDLATGRVGRRRDLPCGLEVRRTPTGLRFVSGRSGRTPAVQDTGLPFRYTLASPGLLPLTLEIPEGRCRLVFDMESTHAPLTARMHDTVAIRLDLDQLRFPLIVRNRLPGDRLHPFGMAGTQKVKTVMINEKVPAHLRDRLPLLIDGDEEILWVAGVRRSNLALMRPETRQALRVCLEVD